MIADIGNLTKKDAGKIVTVGINGQFVGVSKEELLEELKKENKVLKQSLELLTCQFNEFKSNYAKIMKKVVERNG